MTQGKIERYHRSLKNVVKLEHYYTPREVERAVGGFAEDCNHRRYHEAAAERDACRHVLRATGHHPGSSRSDQTTHAATTET